MSMINDLKALAANVKADLEIKTETTEILTQVNKLLEGSLQNADMFSEPKLHQYFYDEFLKSIAMTLSNQGSFTKFEVTAILIIFVVSRGSKELAAFAN